MFTYKTIEETQKELESDKKRGLSRMQAAARLQRNGPNEMPVPKQPSLFFRFLEQLKDPLIYVLLAAAVISCFLDEWNDALIIGVVVFLNAAVGLIQEGKAKRALGSLRALTTPKAMVIREGQRQEIAASQLVVGDLVCLETGCRVPADLRLVESTQLRAEESALTGESVPVEKRADYLPMGKGADFLPGKDVTPLGERKNMVYMSTVITAGRGLGLVTAVGMDTEIGKIAAFISGEKEEATPLQKRLGDLGTMLSLLSLALCFALFFLAVLQKRDVMEMLLTAISLAVAAVPEGLPAVVTICLALSVTRMAKVNTVIRKLPSVETLGAVSVVCTDKTGTLTRNKMTVERCIPASENFREPLLSALVLCNNAVYDAGVEEGLGDPTELALLEYAAGQGVNREYIQRQRPRVGELAFDSGRKRMTTFHRGGNGHLCAYTKGAPESVLQCCSAIASGSGILRLNEREKRKILAKTEALSKEALRTLAVAFSQTADSRKEENLVFLGLIAMTDPPRPEAKEAIGLFTQAGVSTVMITGDHVDTACAIGKQLGIVKEAAQCMTGSRMEELTEDEFRGELDRVRVFARVSPMQKVRIVKGFQAKGKIVAMTGDGVNDAPSLKIADIGISMGKTGTDVARQASDMILTDDNFATIEKAMEEGRGVYENIRKTVIFLISSNLGEILTMFLTVLLCFPSPLKSAHILWINLITDSLPALALGMDTNDGKSLMHHPPRGPKESLFSRGGFACTCFYGLLIGLVGLAAFFLIPFGILKAEGMPFHLLTIRDILSREGLLSRAQTYAFTVLGMSQLYHAVGMRNVRKSFFCMNHLENKVMILACLVGFALQFAVTEIPFLIGLFGTTHLNGREWMYLSLLSAAPLFAHELLALFSRDKG